MAEKYYSILTNRGKELEAQSSATGKPVIIKDFVVGDGNGQPVTPDPALTALIHEVYRSGISALQVSPDQANQFIAQLVLPPDVGGFVVREVGLLTDAGELYAVANCAAIEKPVSGISVTLQFRLAVSETADIELKVATGDGLFLRQDANLGDVKDAAESRKNIGLKGAAVLDVGTAANTVAAGDDSRIVNALQKGNDLSDVVDKRQARVNLELKSGATADVQTSKDDVTAGRLVANGGALALRTVSARAGTAIPDASALPANSVSFCYGDAAYSPGYEATILDVGGLSGNYRVQYAASYADGGKRLKFRTLNADNGYWGRWTNVITNYGGSVDYLDGARYYATKPEYWQGGGAFSHQYADGSAPFFVGGYSTAKDNSVYLPIVKGTSVTKDLGWGSSVSFGILRSGNGDFGSAVIHIIGDSGAGAIFSFDANGTFNTPAKINSGGALYAARQIDSGGNIVAGQGLYESGGLVRVYSSNNPPPQQDLSPYATTAWVNGNFSTQAWTVANFLQGGIRLASLGTANNGNNDNEFAYAPNGAVVTAVQQRTNYTAVQYRYVQYNIGGNWYTAWVA
ncbi:phage tail protein [Enterobacter asburiae]|uniref:phage tail protein n=1 Tax=Enterobacter asburiae TaxID=61645 RepID=UPI00069F142B|nr:phage tail protein [Enterobacter asburiae]EMB8996703.1 phage tail protein [Enterobacter asburiae]